MIVKLFLVLRPPLSNFTHPLLLRVTVIVVDIEKFLTHPDGVLSSLREKFARKMQVGRKRFRRGTMYSDIRYIFLFLFLGGREGREFIVRSKYRFAETLSHYLPLPGPEGKIDRWDMRRPPANQITET